MGSFDPYRMAFGRHVDHDCPVQYWRWLVCECGRTMQKSPGGMAGDLQSGDVVVITSVPSTRARSAGRGSS